MTDNTARTTASEFLDSIGAETYLHVDEDSEDIQMFVQMDMSDPELLMFVASSAFGAIGGTTAEPGIIDVMGHVGTLAFKNDHEETLFVMIPERDVWMQLLAQMIGATFNDDVLRGMNELITRIDNPYRDLP